MSLNFLQCILLSTKYDLIKKNKNNFLIKNMSIQEKWYDTDERKKYVTRQKNILQKLFIKIASTYDFHIN
jgi:hypothetical protein